MNRLTLYFLFIIALNSSRVLSQHKETTFDIYTHLNGLSNSHVNCIAQDSKGFMWFGTDYGLNKFDGFNFVKYFNIPGDKNSLPSLEASALHTDEKGYLWVGTYNGLARFDHRTEKFESYFRNKDSIQYYKPVRAIIGDGNGKIWIGTSGEGIMVVDVNLKNPFNEINKTIKKAIGQEYVYALLMDKQNNLWIGTEENGIKVYNTKTNKVRHFTTQNSILKSNSILTLFEDKNGDVWIGTRGGGLALFKTKTQSFDNSFEIGNVEDEIYSFAYNKDGLLWIGTDNGGLIVFNHSTNKITKHSAYAEEKNFETKRIRALFTDKDGNIWLGIHQLGVGLMKNHDYPFQKSNIKLPPEIKIANSSILGLTIDSENNLWLGTDGNGLIKYNIESKKYNIYTSDKSSTNALQDNVIRTIYEDSKGNIWIGTYKGGLSRYNKKSNDFENYKYTANNPFSISYNDVVAILEDKDKRLWVATNGGGLNLYDPQKNNFTRFTTKSYNSTSTICSDWLTCLFCDNEGVLWIGSFWGLSKLDTESLHFTNYYNISSNKQSLSSNIVYAINQLKTGKILIGTKNGLNILTEDNTFKQYGIDKGFPNNVINSILIDNKNNAWMGTNNGLAKFNLENNEIKSFFYKDGLSSNEFIHNSANKTKNGFLLFGSVFGFNGFYPDSIDDEDLYPNVYVTDFKIFNESVPIGETENERIILNQAINQTNEIVLEYSDNSFSFDFVAINYNLPEKIVYACKMEGFDKNWKYLNHTRRYITYTNLDPGKYTFEVKASTNKKKWSENFSQITIHIKPPFWKTKIAYLIYLLISIYLIYLSFKIYFARIDKRNKLKLEKIKQAQAENLNQAKLEFFTNISHEFRTPLTLILGPIENILTHEKLSKNVKKSLSLTLRNAHRMLRLVNQLLDFRKLERGKLKLETQKLDLVKFVNEIYESFQDLAVRKKINYQFIKDFEELDLFIDADKLDKILFNLLSNAFKFTNENDQISIEIKKENTDSKSSQETVAIIVRDNGLGMSENTQKEIFNRFYQSEGSWHGGSGIGLSLTKSLVEIHHGSISVESKKGEGSVFKVQLPMGKQHLKEHEIIENLEYQLNNINVEPIQSPILEEYKDFDADYSTSLAENLNTNESKPLILVVDDNEDVRAYLRSSLENNYKVEEAGNGKEGLIKVQELLPDLVISDVMMPEMDGINLCKKIKSDLVSCHIPVILLTAKSSVEHRIEGLETGADSYIPKPFNQKHLFTRIKKLIELRSKLKQKFNSDSEFEPAKMEVTSSDERLLNKAIETIKLKISDADFSVENLGQEVGLSRGHLHRKLKALVGQTPSEFIRTIRLKQAAYLLKNEDISVSEITYLVGFSSPSYFTSCFNKLYGITPTQYKNENMGI